MKKRHLLLYAMFVVIVSACQSSPKDLVPDATQSIPVIEVTQPKTMTFVDEILISGTAKAKQSVVVHSRVSGYVSSILVDIGDHVKQSQVLAILSNPDLHGELAMNQASAIESKAWFNRIAKVHQLTPSLTNEQVIDKAQSDMDKDEAMRKLSQDRVDHLTIRAPFDAVIAQRFVDVGSMVQSGLTQSQSPGVVELQDIRDIRMTVHLPESDVALIHIGMPVVVTMPALNNRQITASISRMSGVLDSKMKTMQVEIDLNNRDEQIAPGMYAKVVIETASATDVLAIPKKAIWLEQGKAYVFTVLNGVVVKQQVEQGLSSLTHVQCMNSDFSPSSLVVTQGKSLVHEGQKVAVELRGSGS